MTTEEKQEQIKRVQLNKEKQIKQALAEKEYWRSLAETQEWRAKYFSFQLAEMKALIEIANITGQNKTETNEREPERGAVYNQDS